MKKFVLMIYQGTTPLPGSEAWATLTADEQRAIYADYQALNQTAGVVSGPPLGLPEAATTVQVREGQTRTRTGTHVKDAVGGFLVLEAETLADAIKVAERIPAARLGGAVEIRPAEVYW